MHAEEINITYLNEETKREMLSLANPELAYFFKEEKPVRGKKVIRQLLYAVFDEETLQGFALVVFLPSFSLGDIKQLYLKEIPAKKEAATRLLHCIEDSLKRRGCLILQHQYEEDEGAPTPFIELFLQAEGFGLKSLRMARLYFDIFAFLPPWFLKTRPLPPDFSFFPWKEVTPQELMKLHRMQEQFTVHPFISPTDEEESMQPINSIGLRYKAELVGWMVTHTLPYEPDQIRYSAFYVSPEFLNRGVAVPLLQESIRRQQRSPIQWGYLLLNFGYTDKRWLRFVEARIRPNAYRLVRIWRLSKALAMPRSAQDEKGKP
ncbi:hypothetical protein [Estrella lausannensis]|uniref:N-acetyltransferase domain-containing protein n=1 Tax=Estrella lausannensis TaxID=483423 RepID=A0A0H5DNH8_9BACT|nr:hypothetical protein [Estrella lausannensis]CRX37767.1 Conserved hypothetical protein [Estrella lausannensis]